MHDDDDRPAPDRGALRDGEISSTAGRDAAYPPSPDGAVMWDDHDTPAEVDAAFRTQRRVALGYAALFVLVTLAVPVLGIWVDWWSSGRLLGGLSPSFLMVAVGLYLVFFGLALASAMLAGSVEDRMLGEPEQPYLDDAEDLEEREQQ